MSFLLSLYVQGIPKLILFYLFSSQDTAALFLDLSSLMSAVTLPHNCVQELSVWRQDSLTVLLVILPLPCSTHIFSGVDGQFFSIQR